MADNVNHPAHYEASTSIECIEAMELMFGPNAVYYFCMCNAFKYVWRHKNKNGQEDLDKAGWYLDKAFDIAELSDAETPSLEDLRARLTELRDQKEKAWQE